MKRHLQSLAAIVATVPGLAIGTILAQKAADRPAPIPLFDAVKSASPAVANIMYSESGNAKETSPEGVPGSSSLDTIARAYGKEVLRVRGISVLQDTLIRAERPDDRIRAAAAWAEANGVGIADLDAFSEEVMRSAHQAAEGIKPGLHNLDSIPAEQRQAAIDVLYGAGSLTATWRLRALLATSSVSVPKPK